MGSLLIYLSGKNDVIHSLYFGCLFIFPMFVLPFFDFFLIIYLFLFYMCVLCTLLCLCQVQMPTGTWWGQKNNTQSKVVVRHLIWVLVTKPRSSPKALLRPEAISNLLFILLFETEYVVQTNLGKRHRKSADCWLWQNTNT